MKFSPSSWRNFWFTTEYVRTALPQLIDFVDSFMQYCNAKSVLVTWGIHYSTLATPTGMLLSATVSLTNLEMEREGKIGQGINKRKINVLCNLNKKWHTFPICLGMIAIRKMKRLNRAWTLETNHGYICKQLQQRSNFLHLKATWYTNSEICSI